MRNFGYSADTSDPVPLTLPYQWLWDIIDEFIYQVSVIMTIVEYIYT